MGQIIDEKTMHRMIEGIFPPFNNLHQRPLNKSVVEYILRRRYGQGACIRGKIQLVVGIIAAVISLSWLLLISVPTLIFWVIFEGVSGLIIYSGVSNIRDWKPNEQKIASNNYCLKEAFVTNYEDIFDSDAEDSHIFTFTDGEKVNACSGTNCDRLFYDHGKMGDCCLLLFFEENDIPTYVFDTRWWTLQPDLECFVKRHEINQPTSQATAEQWKSQW